MDTPLPGEIDEAKRNPDGCVYRIAGHFGPNDAVPPEAIIGVRKWGLSTNLNTVALGGGKRSTNHLLDEMRVKSS